jgi:hypothetical protein
VSASTAKKGMSAKEAKELYIKECERQVATFGTKA